MASYFASYFKTSSMPKRLLQYALSRLEILETEALDVENLDIAWGRESTFEFKNVGLRLKKLEALLQLPPSVELSKANILLLRVTIPVDIYSSPIRVEVDGVESQLKVKSQADSSRVRTDHDRKRKRSSPKPSDSNIPHTRRHRTRTSSDPAEDENIDTALPSATDLAESFLQTEPEEGRAELEAALLSETSDLGSSSVLSDDGDIPLGTGTALSLPAFMANFLNGIVDRLQVTVCNIIINLDVDLPNESTRPSTSNSKDSVTIQLRVDDVKVEGVTHELDEKPNLHCKLGKRLVELSSIRGFLISEANFFSSLARSSALSSPSAAHSDIFVERRDSRSSPTIQRSIIGTFDGTSPPELTGPVEPTESLLFSKNLSVASSGTRLSDLHVLDASIITSDGGRFDDAPEDDEASTMSTSRHTERNELTESIFENSAYPEEGTGSRSLEVVEDGENKNLHHSVEGQSTDLPIPSAVSTPRASTLLSSAQERDSTNILALDADPEQGMLESTVLPERSHHKFSEERVSHSQSSLAQGSSSISSYHGGDNSPVLTPTAEPDHTSHGSDEKEEGSSPAAEEDLTQSQLFSHEDAESMYMSAISHVSSRTRIPGGWTRSISGSEELELVRDNPSATQREETRDNLEHALHNPPIANFQEIEARTSTWNSDSEDSLGSQSLRAPVTTHTQQIPAMRQRPSNSSELSNISPSDYSQLAKQVLNLDRILIYLPGIGSESQISPAEVDASSVFDSKFDSHSDFSQSTSVNVPGAFSTHLPNQKTPPRHVSAKAEPIEPEPNKQTTGNGKSIELEIGQLNLQFDISVGRLVFKLVQELKEMLYPKAQTEAASNTNNKPSNMEISVQAKEISLEFLERLQGTLAPPGAAPEEVPTPKDVLLQTKLTDLQIVARNIDTATTKTSLSLGRFVFGYAQENIVSFDKKLQLGASVRDLSASAGIDISAHITQNARATRCEISTLPMHISIDLRRLDETFSWFGGLSSVLNLGNSIASNTTVMASPSQPKPRGVRFETPIRPDDRSMTIQNKADVRIGGIILDLVGTECRIDLRTSAVKVVSRDEGIGLSIQKMRLSGPHLKGTSREPAITVEVTSTRIEYLTSPKDTDLDRLLSLITPSKSKYDQDDDILVDTLLRQRKQGAVLRLTIEDCNAHLAQLHELKYLPELIEEVSRLGTVAKYLPEDDRPGLLSLVTVRKFNGHIDLENGFGSIQLSSGDVEVAQITFPSLIALSVGGITAHRNNSEEILGIATDPRLREPRLRVPSIMARLIGDEMDPTVRIKLCNLKFEYRVATLITLLGLTEHATSQDISASLSASVATLTGLAGPQEILSPSLEAARDDTASTPSKTLTIDVVLRDCILGLNPLGLPSKVLVVLTEAHLKALRPNDESLNASADLSKASILVIDDVANVGMVEGRPRRQSFDGGSNQVSDLCTTGYVSVSYISSARALIQMINTNGENSIDIEVRDDLFVLETCADSTQTLIAVLNGLSPPAPPPKEIKYRTKVIPVHDLLASLSGDAFGTAEGDYNFDDDFAIDENADDFPENDDGEFDFDSNYYQEGGDVLFDETLEGGSNSSNSQLITRDTLDGVLLDSVAGPGKAEEDNEELDFQEDHFGTGSILEGTAHRWNSAKNTYDRSNAAKVRKSPLKVCVRDVHIIWNLFDGYDWQNTRDKITKAVQNVESKAIEQRARNERRPTFEQDVDDEETVIGDFLFNSIYIGIPANRDPRELTAAINQELNDNATETESIATTTVSASPSRQVSARRSKSHRLRLNRSKHHKITFELRGVNVDLVAFPPGSGETQSSVDIRVNEFEIFDHIPTSTWKKFATYMQDAGERETGTSMIHIELLNVKPVADLAASEIVLKATILPLRLHVDQDALDFITRFFEFKDDSVPANTSPGDVPFLQRVEVNSVTVKLDFKPKRVDYAGLRSGHTTEFMNFLILEEADMVLRHTIIYGISGFDKMGKCLNDIWMPDIKRNQLPGILAGLAPVRSLVNVGGGFRHLVVVPMREYKKDGRIVRSISKGAAAFAKTTGTEVVKLGAKVAIGVQTVLQGVEGFLGSPIEASSTSPDEESEEENKQISLYANQPVGVLQGLRGGYNGLQRDLIMARDAIIAVPGEVMEGGTAAGALRAVRKHAPTVILRPAIGIAKAGGQILMGATNSLDPVNLQRAEAKYKKH